MPKVIPFGIVKTRLLQIGLIAEIGSVLNVN